MTVGDGPMISVVRSPWRWRIDRRDDTRVPGVVFASAERRGRHQLARCA